MDWNWVWVVLAIGAAFYFFRGGLGGHAGGHGGGLGGLLGGLGHGGLGGHGHGGHGGRGEDRGHGEQGEPPARPAAADAPEAAIDPVGGEAVRTAQALTSVYDGKIYYFASKESRDRFEAAPQEYAHKAAGHPVRSAEAPHERPRKSRGC